MSLNLKSSSKCSRSLKYVGGSPLVDYGGTAPNRARANEGPSYTFKPVPSHFYVEIIQETENREDACHGRYRTLPGPVGITGCVHVKGEWHTSLLHCLLKTESSDDMVPIPYTVHGGLYRLAGRRADIIDFEHKEQI